MRHCFDSQDLKLRFQDWSELGRLDGLVTFPIP